MYVIVVVLAVFLGVVTVFVLLHLRPLDEAELESLAAKRRSKKIDVYFAFSGSPVSANADFKRRMAAGGRFYNVHVPLPSFPRTAAALLKGKKHEWIIVGMEKNREITCMWANKGEDGKHVSWPFGMLAREAKAGGYSSILVLHNHPNPNPVLYSMREASPTDLNSAQAQTKTLSIQGMNLAEFVCERGVPYRYWFFVADAFLPVADFLRALRSENGVSKRKNLSLHSELIF